MDDDDEELTVNLTSTCRVDPEALAHALMYERVDAAEFIKRLDMALQDWDVTVELADHFAAQKLIYEAEMEGLK